MKHLLIFCLISIWLILSSSCRYNRLRTNEKDLAKEILSQEKANKEARTSLVNESTGTKGKHSGTFRKKEIRSIDTRNPPIILDLLSSSNIIRLFKLSDIASSIRYVKLQLPPDTLLLSDPGCDLGSLISSISSDDRNIIFQGLFGLTLFSMQGEYQETIWKNQRGIEIRGKAVMWRPQEFYGVMPNNPVSTINGNVYYFFNDGPKGNGQVMKYKTDKNKNLSIQSKSEVPGLGTILGDTLLDTNRDLMERFDWVFGIGEGTWTGINNKWIAGRSGSLLVTYNENGDTLCQFSDYDRIANFSHTNYRVQTKLANYFYDGLLTIKQEYNDTVFRLIPPDRLLPAYIFSWGDYKINYKDGLNPDFDLSNKYILNSLFETNNYLFIKYTQYSDSPSNRKKNVVKFYNALYEKKGRKLYHQSERTSLPVGLKNDLDGGLPFWPEFITPQGEMMKLVSGKMIKDYINSTEFKETEISEEKRQKQISMALGLKPRDMVVVIAK